MATFLDLRNLRRSTRRVLGVGLLFSVASVSSVVSLFSAEPGGPVRIAVLELFRPAELTVRPASGSVLVIKGDSNEIILQDAREAHLYFSSEGVRCRSGEYSLAAPVIRGEGRDGGPTEFILSVPGRISRQYRGKLEVGARDGKLVPVVAMELEAAVASVVAAESPPNAPIEALKAQAVVTRSYFLAGPRHSGFAFCDTTHCQYLREPPAADAPASAAAAATRGLLLTYGGKIFRALFSASCGGQTRSLVEAGLSPGEYPYYRVHCQYCLLHAARWSRTLDLETVYILLAAPLTEGKRLSINRKLGWDTVPGNNYAIQEDGQRLIIRGSGHGHGVGLCQMGASGMAAQGSTFRQILNHYFPNSSLDGRDE